VRACGGDLGRLTPAVAKRAGHGVVGYWGVGGLGSVVVGIYTQTVYSFWFFFGAK
jgi:hypothetical protein